MIIYKWFAIAQARYPRQVGRLMRLATSTIPRMVRRKHSGVAGGKMAAGGGVETKGRASGEAGTADPQRDQGGSWCDQCGSQRDQGGSQRDPRRTNGILAANYAARVPGAR